MDIFSINLQCFTTAARQASLLCCINTPQLQTGATHVKCLHFNPQNGISRNRRHLCEIDWTLNSSAVCISKRKYETGTVNRHTAGSNYACRLLGWIQNGIFTQWVLCFFFKHKRPTTKNSVNPVLNGYYSHTHTQVISR